MSVVSGATCINHRFEFYSARNDLLTRRVNLQSNDRYTLTSANALMILDSALGASAINIDLVGTGTDALGDTMSVSHIMAIHFVNEGDHTMSIGTGANQLSCFASAVTVPAQGCFTIMSSNGIAASGGSSDCLGISGTNGDSYKLVVIGKV